MSIFGFVKKKGVGGSKQPKQREECDSKLASLVLNSIEEGVIIVQPNGVIELANPAAMRMLGADDTGLVYNLQVGSVLKLETAEGVKIEDGVNPVLRAIALGENLSTRDYVIVSMQEQRRPMAITVVSTNSGQSIRIVTLRDISRELEEEGEQTEFISTASHEMRTPVASIEGYLGLALNPKTATIDERARKYLEEAQTSSRHLGRLFKDLLDVTKLDDKKIRVHLSPIEVSSTVRSIVNGQVPQMSEKGIHYTFGTNTVGSNTLSKTLNQEVYASVDIDFLREAVNNLVENAIKYTDNGGGIWVNVRGDDDRVLINVTDTGIGISPEDLKHVFQKFYRADNSQTRTVGGTGLGLYLVKQRVEAMGGKVWAESSFGEGSTFYISFPRITAEEYQRRKQIASNIENMNTAIRQAVNLSQPLNDEGQLSTQINPMNREARNSLDTTAPTSATMNSETPNQVPSSAFLPPIQIQPIEAQAQPSTVPTQQAVNYTQPTAQLVNITPQITGNNINYTQTQGSLNSSTQLNNLSQQSTSQVPTSITAPQMPLQTGITTPQVGLQNNPIAPSAGPYNPYNQIPTNQNPVEAQPLQTVSSPDTVASTDVINIESQSSQVASSTHMGNMQVPPNNN